MPGPYGGALPGASALNPVPGTSRAAAVTETNSIIALSTRVDRILTELASHYSDTDAHDLASYTGGALPIAGGGTGATTAAAARTALATNDAANITAGTLAIARGGTAAGTAAAARASLGTDNASNITSGTLAVANGGTGSATAALARVALGTDNASNLTSGTVAFGRLGSGGTGTGSKVLYDNSTWGDPGGGGGGATFDGPWVFGKTYGVIGDGSDQTTPLFTALFAAGGTAGHPPLVLPAGIVLCPTGIQETIDSLTVIGSAIPFVGSGFTDTTGTVIKTTQLGQWCWQHYNDTFASANDYKGPKFIGILFEGVSETTTVAAASNGVNVNTFTGSQTLTLASSTLSGGSSLPTPAIPVAPMGRATSTDPVLYCTVTGLTGGSGKAVVSFTGVSGAVLQNVTLISGTGTLATGNTAIFSTAGGLSIEAANGVVEECHAENHRAGIGFRNGTPVGSAAGGDVAWCFWKNPKAENCAIGFDLGRQEVGNSNAAGEYHGLTTLCNSSSPSITQGSVGVLIRYNTGGFVNIIGGKDENCYYGVLHRGANDRIVERKSEACNYLLSQVRPTGATGGSRNHSSFYTGSGGIIELGALNDQDRVKYSGSGVTLTNNSTNSIIEKDDNSITQRANVGQTLNVVETASGGTILTRSIPGTGSVRDTLSAGKLWSFRAGDTTSVEVFRFEDSAAAAILRLFANGNVIVDKAASTLTVNGGFAHAGTTAGFYGHAAAAKPTVTGAKGGNAALGSLLTALAGLGLLTDSSSA